MNAADSLSHDEIVHLHDSIDWEQEDEYPTIKFARAIIAADRAKRATQPPSDHRDAVIELCASEAEHWQKISKPDHCCGQYIAAAIRNFKSSAGKGAAS